MVKRAAIYARISHAAEGDSLGVMRQEKECRALAKQRGWKVDRVFVENDVSAFSGRKRPQFEAMLDAVRNGSVQAVIAWHPDRLYRHLRDLETFVDVVETSKAAVATVSAGDVDLSTASGRGVARILGAIARMESEHKAERLAAKHRELAESGAWQGGPAPFGFVVVGGKKADATPARLVVNDAEAAAIRDAATRVFAGTSLHRITIDWNDAGILPHGGGRWTPSHVKRVLVAPTTAGVRIVNSTPVPGSWDAILEPDVRELLISKLDHGPRRNSQKPNAIPRRFALTGLVTCARDGTPMRGEMVNEKRWAYRCATSAGGCGRVRVSGIDLEQLILDLVDERWEEPASPPPSSDPTPEEAKLLAELAKANARIERLAEDYADGALTGPQVKTATTKLEARRGDLSEKLADIVALREKPEVHWREAFARVDDWEARRKAGTLTPQEVAEFHDRVAAYVERISIEPTKRGTRFSPDRVRIVWRHDAAA